MSVFPQPIVSNLRQLFAGYASFNVTSFWIALPSFVCYKMFLNSRKYYFFCFCSFYIYPFLCQTVSLSLIFLLAFCRIFASLFFVNIACLVFLFSISSFCWGVVCSLCIKTVLHTLSFLHFVQ
jgi:hypothetical protein